MLCVFTRNVLGELWLTVQRTQKFFNAYVECLWTWDGCWKAKNTQITKYLSYPIRSEIYKIINSICNKEPLSEKWGVSIIVPTYKKVKVK